MEYGEVDGTTKRGLESAPPSAPGGIEFGPTGLTKLSRLDTKTFF